jgi:hypothetical protein
MLKPGMMHLWYNYQTGRRSLMLALAPTVVQVAPGFAYLLRLLVISLFANSVKGQPKPRLTSPALSP